MKDRLSILGVLACSALASHALAQSNVSNAAKFSWGENVGWMNWRDAGAIVGSQGVELTIGVGYLEGFIWCENIGWVNVGNGAGPYLNTTGANFGVNVNPCNGQLSGFAWGENVGWINFRGGALANPPQPARFDFTARRLRGFAWGENIGWISLNEPTDALGKYVGFVLPPTLCDCLDFNQDGLFPDTQDIEDFISVFQGGPCSTGNCNDLDFNNDGLFPDTLDLQSLLSVFASGPCL